MANKLFRISLTAMIISALFLIVFVACALLGIAPPSYGDGFGVDSQEQVYLGTDGSIDVFLGNRRVRQIDPPTSRGYNFTLTPGDTIVLSTGDRLYTMDLDGNILSESESSPPEILRNPVTECEQGGITYRMTETEGRMTVIREQQGSRKIIFQQPLSQMFYTAAFALISVCFWLSILLFVGVSRYRAREQKHAQGRETRDMT